jgi:hypothetical protein
VFWRVKADTGPGLISVNDVAVKICFGCDHPGDQPVKTDQYANRYRSACARFRTTRPLHHWAQTSCAAIPKQFVPCVAERGVIPQGERMAMGQPHYTTSPSQPYLRPFD